MDVAGSTLYVKKDYKPVTVTTIEWIQKADGNWSGFDRKDDGSYDKYLSDVVFTGTEAELSNLETELGTYSQRSTLAITCGTGEEIFGMDINYSSELTVSVVEYGKIKRTFNNYEMPLRLKLHSPSKTGSGSLANLRIAGNNFEAYSEFDLARDYYYEDSEQDVKDGQSDSGIFRAVFRQTPSEMQAIRRYLLNTKRTASFSFPTGIGVTYPFGKRMGEGPFNCHAIAWEDRRLNYMDWECTIVFVRVFE